MVGRSCPASSLVLRMRGSSCSASSRMRGRSRSTRLRTGTSGRGSMIITRQSEKEDIEDENHRLIFSENWPKFKSKEGFEKLRF